MVEALRIEYLADCPEVLSQLEKWFLREWAPYYVPMAPGMQWKICARPATGVPCPLRWSP